MDKDDIIREKLDFLKLEYEFLCKYNEHLEKSEWKVRQLSITLWLASLSVGIGLQGDSPNNFYILFLSTGQKMDSGS